MPRRLPLPLLAALACAGSLAAAGPTSAQGILGLERVASFEAPLYVTAPPRDLRRVFVVEQAGRIRLVRDGAKLSRPFLDLSSEVLSGGERGLLSMAFAPDYATSGRFYVYFTDGQGDIRVDELRRSRNPDRAQRAGRRTLLDIPHRRFANHNGGTLQFGPDRLLYVSTGDGGGRYDPAENAQSLRSLLGKILRIDPRPAAASPYRLPADNPFRGRPGARGEIFAYGLRNPWRFSFDRTTGDLVIADVGQSAVEEVNFVRRGQRGMNFGWDAWEGNTRVSTEPSDAVGHVRPVLERFHSSGDCSITGGYVVRNPSVAPLLGRYIHGDLCTGELRSAVLDTPSARDPRPLGRTVSQLSSFGEDARGCPYAVSLEGGVYRLVASGAQGACGDQIKPTLRLRAPRRQRARRRGRAVVYVRCDEPCVVAAKGSVRISGRSRRIRLKAVREFVPRGGDRATLRLRLSRAGSRAVRRAVRRGRRTRAFIRLRARDMSANRSALSRRTVRFRR